MIITIWSAVAHVPICCQVCGRCRPWCWRRRRCWFWRRSRCGLPCCGFCCRDMHTVVLCKERVAATVDGYACPTPSALKASQLCNATTARRRADSDLRRASPRIARAPVEIMIITIWSAIAHVPICCQVCGSCRSWCWRRCRYWCGCWGRFRCGLPWCGFRRWDLQTSVLRKESIAATVDCDACPPPIALKTYQICNATNTHRGAHTDL
jgi:hypothetical protein